MPPITGAACCWEWQSSFSVFLLFYDVIFRPSLIPYADALKEHGLETGGACVGKYARSLWRGRFSMQVSSVSYKARATFASAGEWSGRMVLSSICSLHPIECLIHLWIIQNSQKSSITFGCIQRNDYLCTRWWVINGCWLSVRCSLMQFIAECGIEYGLKIV